LIRKTRLARLFLKIDINENVAEVVDACFDFQRKGWGALIVITRTTGLENIVDSGERLDAKINKELLVSIFNPKSPLHDGAVIINNNKIEAARCLLPLSEIQLVRNRSLGTRHRAGLGISEQSDAIAVIVSEETSIISVAENGQLYPMQNIEDLKEKLKEVMGNTNVTKNLKSILESSKNVND
jgi:diadenylate cyclase